MNLRVIETFVSVDGEVNCFGQGVLSMFIRLAGCNLQCPWCDTKWSQDSKNGYIVSVERLHHGIIRSKIPKVTITGGEPFLQSNALFYLCHWLLSDGVGVTVETNGTMPYLDFRKPLLEMDTTAWFGLVVDHKPDSACVPDNQRLEPDYQLLQNRDWVKFPVANRRDLSEAFTLIDLLYEDCTCGLAISPVFNGEGFDPSVTPERIVTELAARRLYKVRLNIQLHKTAGVM